MTLFPRGALRPTRMTWVVFPLLAIAEFSITYWGFLTNQDFLQDLFWYQMIWFSGILELMGFNTSAGEMFSINRLGFASNIISILIDLFIIYLISLYLSKRVFKKGYLQYTK